MHRVFGLGRFYKYLNTWHKELVCERIGVSYEEGKSVDRSSWRRYNPATAVKYADAIARLKEGGISTAMAATEYGLHPECLRQYLKEHEPELHASLGMQKTEKGGVIAGASLRKYNEALQLYATTSLSIRSLAKRFGFNACAFGQFINRQFPDLRKQHDELLQRARNA